jgi:hypothetical protein
MVAVLDESAWACNESDLRRGGQAPDSRLVFERGQGRREVGTIYSLPFITSVIYCHTLVGLLLGHLQRGDPNGRVGSFV